MTGTAAGVELPPAVGCGVRLGPAGEIEADTAPFASLTRFTCGEATGGDPGATAPFDPACEAEGAAVYCASDGTLRTLPEKHHLTGSASMTDNTVVSVLPHTSATMAGVFTNPSDCYCMCGMAQFAFIPAISSAAGTVIFLAHEVDLGDGVFTPVTGYVLDQRGKTATSGGIRRQELHLPVCLDPGETKTLHHRVRFTRFTGDNGGAVSITQVAQEIRYDGSNV